MQLITSAARGGMLPLTALTGVPCWTSSTTTSMPRCRQRSITAPAKAAARGGSVTV
jgi:hypothetical protein